MLIHSSRAGFPGAQPVSMDQKTFNFYINKNIE